MDSESIRPLIQRITNPQGKDTFTILHTVNFFYGIMSTGYNHIMYALITNRVAQFAFLEPYVRLS